MKKLFCTLLAITALTLASNNASAQTNYINAEQLAQAYLAYNVDHYSGTLGANMISPSNTQTYVEIYFVMTKDLYITNMTINGTNIPLSAPLSGLPIPVSGYSDVGFQLYAWDKNGNWASQGYTNMNFLPQESSLSIVMYPHFPPVGIPVTTSDPNSIQVTVTGASSWGWYYDSNLGEVVISYLSGSTGNVSYRITDSSGLIAHGQLQFFQNQGVAESMVVNPQQAGNVLEADVDGNNSWQSDLNFDCTVLRSNAYVPAKVIDVPDIAYQSGLYVYVYGVAGATVEVRSDTGNGQLTLVPVTIQSQNNDPSYGWTIVSTSQYLNKAVVTVLPPNGGKLPSNFQIAVERW